MSKYLHILLIGLTCVLVIVLYGTYRCKKTDFQDPLTKSFVPPPFDKYLDGWGISHFMFFALLGFLYPQKALLAFSFTLGVIWELIEYSAKDHPFYISKCNYTNLSNDGGSWWYGRWQDIVMNTLGLIAGYSISKLR
jgi:hypothetical protein